jgi:hypothetical protein
MAQLEGSILGLKKKQEDLHHDHQLKKQQLKDI